MEWVQFTWLHIRMADVSRFHFFGNGPTSTLGGYLFLQNYIKLLKLGFEKKIFIGIATHDKQLIDECCKIIQEKNIDTNNFEFQVLYGVPITKTIKKFYGRY